MGVLRDREKEKTEGVVAKGRTWERVASDRRTVGFTAEWSEWREREQGGVVQREREREVFIYKL